MNPDDPRSVTSRLRQALADLHRLGIYPTGFIAEPDAIATLENEGIMVGTMFVHQGTGIDMLKDIPKRTLAGLPLEIGHLHV